MPRIAIIDLGTNTFHLLIAQVENGEMQLLHKEKQSVKIGENGISQGEISLPARERAIQTLQAFKQKINAMQVDRVHAKATSAFRNARNGIAFAKEILELTGIDIKIIGGMEEAKLIYQGVRQAIDMGVTDSLIMDIGGGSVEFIIADTEEIKWMHSFEIGAQRLMDRFHHHDPIIQEEMINLESFLDHELAPLAAAINQYHPSVLIGASGTFDTLSEIFCLDQGLEKSSGPEGALTIEGFRKIHDLIIHKTREQRLAIPGMIEMRVDMIVVACSLINYILRRFKFDQIKVSSYALKEGLLQEVLDEIRNDHK